MKFTIALTVLLSPAPVSVFAASAAIARKLRCKAGKAPPAITLTGCGQSFNNTKVVLSDNLDCGEKAVEGPPEQCAVSLVGPQAEINCNDYKLSQVASASGGGVCFPYDDGPFFRGICLMDGAKAINCNVEQFANGIYVTNGGGEVVESNLSSNGFGIKAFFDAGSETLTIENTNSSNNENTGLRVERVRFGDEAAQIIAKGSNTFNSNRFNGFFTYGESNKILDIVINSGASLNMDQNVNGFYSSVGTGGELNVDVKDTGSFKSCGNGMRDIFLDNSLGGFDVNVTFTGSGYTCDNFVISNTFGTIVEPVCQACP